MYYFSRTGLIAGRRAATGAPPRFGEDVMHPMFVQLFLEPDADDRLAGEKKRCAARRARRNRSRLAVRVAVGDRDRRTAR